ncbi:helix-turn-helix domain-containing protein [Paenibacillus doosanensis]|uniref:ArsR/SmtB family transcription factor n=1 Tax=Paenibacillus doosanensis TaxID=1229154 RepID=UPI0021804D94|nr:helix-turn-helix domain-containing protein [Paenibacillus doosanensis]MCS7463699.1 helix-turn-helix domain-containing protein [Paenibacillus doosanensis]
MKILYHPAAEEIQLGSVLYALSDPTRLCLVHTIAKQGEQSCSTFEVPIAKSTLSHHIRTLREAGIVRVRIQGTQHFVSLRTEDLEVRFPNLLSTILQAAQNHTMTEEL